MKYFEDWEFDCKCGTCGLGIKDVSPILLDKIVLARKISNVPYSLNSAMRCPVHNEKEEGKPDSSHLIGDAIDIKTSNSYNRFRILLGLIMAGFTRIGIARTFIHVDVDPNKDPEVSWLY